MKKSTVLRPPLKSSSISSSEGKTKNTTSSIGSIKKTTTGISSIKKTTTLNSDSSSVSDAKVISKPKISSSCINKTSSSSSSTTTTTLGKQSTTLETKSKTGKLTTPEEDLYSIQSESSGNGSYVSHIEHLAGPILFSAPHGLQVYRGGEESQDSERVHSKELYTNEICLLLSLKIKKYLGIEASFVIWNPKTAKPKDKSNLDPNYLVASQFMSSPFHRFLHKLKKQYDGFPTLHVDIHGKINRKADRNIDIGIAPMMALWKDQKLAEKVKKDFCDRMQKAVSTCKKKYSGFKLTIDRDPYLSGYWGDNTVTTISHQSILLGMPGLQLEIPMDVRKDLMTNDDLLEQLAKAIAESYKTSVTSIFSKEWKEVEAKLDAVKTELLSHEQTKHNSKTFDSMISQMISEFEIIETSQKGKKI